MHIYSVAGSYIVNLIVSNANGNNSKTGTIKVLENSSSDSGSNGGSSERVTGTVTETVMEAALAAVVVAVEEEVEVPEDLRNFKVMLKSKNFHRLSFQVDKMQSLNSHRKLLQLFLLASMQKRQPVRQQP